MLIDVSYFTAGPRHILNATMGTQSTEVNDAITEYIKAYQWPFLCELLGEDVGTRLHDYLLSEDTVEPDAEPSEDVTDESETSEDGTTEDETSSISEEDENDATEPMEDDVEEEEILEDVKPDEGCDEATAFDTLCKHIAQSFADYVFFKILGENNSQATITGIVTLKCANDPVAPVNRQVQTWNRMVERNRLFVSWCANGGCPITGIVTNSNLLTPINRFNL